MHNSTAVHVHVDGAQFAGGLVLTFKSAKYCNDGGII